MSLTFRTLSPPRRGEVDEGRIGELSKRDGRGDFEKKHKNASEVPSVSNRGSQQGSLESRRHLSGGCRLAAQALRTYMRSANMAAQANVEFVNRSADHLNWPWLLLCGFQKKEH